MTETTNWAVNYYSNPSEGSAPLRIMTFDRVELVQWLADRLADGFSFEVSISSDGTTEGAEIRGSTGNLIYVEFHPPGESFTFLRELSQAISIA